MSRPKKYSDIDFTPPQKVAEVAEQGLRWRRQFERGGTEVGVARARDLKNRVRLMPDTVQRMSSYFARHEVDKTASDFGNDDDPSAGYVAWQLWGGDPGRKWAEKICEQMKSADDESDS